MLILASVRSILDKMDLYKACIEGNTDKVREILSVSKEYCNIQIGNYKLTPLHKASENRYLDIVKLLLDSGADPNLTCANGYTALYMAVHDGFLDIVKEFLHPSRGIILHPNSSLRSHTLLHAAIRSNGEHKDKQDQLEIVRLLLLAGMNPNIADVERITPLELAVCSGLTEIVEELLLHGIVIIDYVPLIYACNFGFSEIVRLLLLAGADSKNISIKSVGRYRSTSETTSQIIKLLNDVPLFQSLIHQTIRNNRIDISILPKTLRAFK